MFLEKTLRWFGQDDEVSLQEIRQSGASGVVTALHHIPNGAIWSIEEIQNRKTEIKKADLTWHIVESLPVHNSIKAGLPERDKLIENYAVSMKHLATCGIDTICYNFMPVLDWVRTDLEFELPDGGITMKYDHITFAAFDIYILARHNAKSDYNKVVIEQAEILYNSMNDEEKVTLASNIIIVTQGFIDGLIDGSTEDYKARFLEYIEEYQAIGTEQLRENLAYFLDRIIPRAEEYGIKMAIHADDPAFPVLGLPRIVSNYEDIAWILNHYKSVNNGITFCTGSLSSNRDNNIIKMASEFADRIHFLHLRNTKYLGDYAFMESGHLNGVVDMSAIIKILSLQERTIPMRPDHGIKILSDLKMKANPGYPLIGRMKGLAELSGLEKGITNS